MRPSPTTIVFRPLRDLIWQHPRSSRLRWEETKVGDCRIAYGSEANIKLGLFKASCSRMLDWTWVMVRAPELDRSRATAWKVTRTA